MPAFRSSFALLAIVVAVSLCGPAQQPPPADSRRTPASATARPNILLITIDTLRADHVGCYGASRAKTPTIDALAKDGMVYERAISQVPLTWPSHAAILTGTYPFHNGVQDFTGQPLSPEVRSVAQALHDHGYATAAVVSSFVLDRSWGLARGFDLYDDAFSGADFLQKDVALVERRAEASVQHALDWLKRRPAAKPFFLWLHLYDPHSPYDPPEPFRSKYSDAPYDGEIAYADAQLGNLIGWLKQRGLYQRTAIILLSDHGESLGEHGEKEHGFFIYNSTVHVPLIAKMPAASSISKRRVTAPVELISTAPTILQIARVKDSIEKQFDGVSLLQKPSAQPLAYSETFYPFSSFGWSPLRGLQSGDLHYIEAPKKELYEVRSDIGETRNLAEQQRATAEVMSARLHRISVEHSPAAPQQGNVDPAVAEKLRSLGYLAYRAPVPASALDKLADPKDKVGELEQILSATDALKAGDFARGRTLLADAQRNDRQLYLIPFMLGEAALRQQDLTEATTQLQAALKLNPNFDQAMMALGRALQAQGNSDEAREWLQRALKQNPQNFRAWYELGFFDMRERPEQAREAFRRVLMIQPNFAIAHRDLGMLAFEEKDYATAAKELQSAADLGLADPKVLNYLGISYSQTGRLQFAVRTYRRALKHDPNLAEAHLNLGFAYTKLGRTAAAKAEYDAACRLDEKMCRLLNR